MEKIYIILLLVVVLCNSTFAQKITKEEGKGQHYSLNNVTYHFDDMEEIFDIGKGLDRTYLSARKSEKNADSFGYLTFSVMAIGTLAIAVDPRPPKHMYCDLFCVSTGVKVGLVSWLFIVPITGTIALSAKFKANKKRNRLINIYNQYVADKKDLGQNNKTSILLRAGITSTGLGISLTF